MNGLPQLFGTGLGLSAAAGLNSYAVLLVYGAIARFFPEDYPGAIARLLASTPALGIAAVLFLLEFFLVIQFGFQPSSRRRRHRAGTIHGIARCHRCAWDGPAPLLVAQPGPAPRISRIAIAHGHNH